LSHTHAMLISSLFNNYQHIKIYKMFRGMYA